MELPSGQAAGPPGFPAYQLIGSTKLLRLIVPSNLPGVVSRKPNIYVILDRSGSMDRWCELAISTAIPSALQQQGLFKILLFFEKYLKIILGYSLDDEVTLITFDSTGIKSV